MRPAIFIPPSMRHSKKCHRCGLLYDENESHCTHCKELSDEEVVKLRKNVEMQNQENKKLGMLFFFICAILLLFMVLI